MFFTRLSEYLSYSLDARYITTYSDLYDDVFLQQLQTSFVYDTKNFVATREPWTSQEAANFADLRARMTGPGPGNATQNSGGDAPPSQKKPNRNHHPQTHQQSQGGRVNETNIDSLEQKICRLCVWVIRP